MLDEFKFAIKCGGPAKKVRTSGSTAIPLKQIEKPLSSPSATVILPASEMAETADRLKSVEMKKSHDKQRQELMHKARPDNAIVCKNDPLANLSAKNPGLLIVEKEFENSNEDDDEDENGHIYEDDDNIISNFNNSNLTVDDDDEVYEEPDQNNINNYDEIYSKNFKHRSTSSQNRSPHQIVMLSREPPTNAVMPQAKKPVNPKQKRGVCILTFILKTN
jgi:hypothetical protein